MKTLKKLENYKINNVLIGDLIYDTYLKKKHDIEPTINLNGNEFKNFVKDFISLYLSW